jgi:hypothetical protein
MLAVRLGGWPTSGFRKSIPLGDPHLAVSRCGSLPCPQIPDVGRKGSVLRARFHVCQAQANMPPRFKMTIPFQGILGARKWATRRQFAL